MAYQRERLPSEERPPRILGIGGSARESSRTAHVMRATLDIFESAGAETVEASVHRLDLPVYNEDILFAEHPKTLHWLLDEMRQADGYLIVSPTYHGTIAGSLKNVLDALHIQHGADYTYFNGRPVGLVAYGGPAAQNVLTAMYHAVRAMRALVVPTSLTVAKTALTEDFSDVAEAPREHGWSRWPRKSWNSRRCNASAPRSRHRPDNEYDMRRTLRIRNLQEQRT